MPDGTVRSLRPSNDNAPDSAGAFRRIARWLGIVLWGALGLTLWSVPFLGLWLLFR